MTRPCDHAEIAARMTERHLVRATEAQRQEFVDALIRQLDAGRCGADHHHLIDRYQEDTMARKKSGDATEPEGAATETATVGDTGEDQAAAAGMEVAAAEMAAPPPNGAATARPLWERKRTIQQSLPVRLTGDDLIRIGDELARANEDIHQEELRQKSVKDALKEKMSEILSRQTRLAGVFRRREEYRDVDVAVEFNYEHGKVREVRLDTGEVVRERVMTPAERQPSLLPETAAKAEAAAAVHSQAAEAEAK